MLNLKIKREPKLIITHIFPSSQLYRSRSLAVGATINEVNGIEVQTLEDFRAALKKSDKFLTIRATDNVSRASDNVLVSLVYDKVLQEETKLAMDFKYPLSKTAQDLIKAHQANRSLILADKEQQKTRK